LPLDLFRVKWRSTNRKPFERKGLATLRHLGTTGHAIRHCYPAFGLDRIIHSSNRFTLVVVFLLLWKAALFYRRHSSLPTLHLVSNA
jgi:hypothetical protein